MLLMGKAQHHTYTYVQDRRTAENGQLLEILWTPTTYERVCNTLTDIPEGGKLLCNYNTIRINELTF